MAKILVVEDDNYLRRDLKGILEKNEYEVVVASTVAESIFYVKNDKNIDIYLLDVWLPDGEGFLICKEIRMQNLKPVIFLSVCDDEESVIKGLNMGGDDYITKPFRTGELLSRIKANLRRMHKTEMESILQCEQLEVNLKEGRVRLGGVNVRLTPVEYALLVKLMENAERIVKRELLHMCLWDGVDSAVEDNTLSVNISRLRSKIGVEYIETIRGFGYRFTKKVNRMV